MLVLANRIADLQEHRRERQSQITAMKHPLDLVNQLQQNETRSDPSGGRPDASCQLGRGMPGVEQSPICTRLFDGGEVLPLQVLDEHDFLLLHRVQIANNDGYFIETRDTRGGQASAARDDQAVNRDQQGLQPKWTAVRAAAVSNGHHRYIRE